MDGWNVGCYHLVPMLNREQPQLFTNINSKKLAGLPQSPGPRGLRRWPKGSAVVYIFVLKVTPGQ